MRCERRCLSDRPCFARVACPVLRRQNFVFMQPNLQSHLQLGRSESKATSIFTQSARHYRLFGCCILFSLSSFRDCSCSYTQRQLYRIIADVDAYSSFIPFVKSSKVLSHSSASTSVSKPWLEPTDEDHVKVKQEMKIGFKYFEEAYVSNVECHKFHTVTVRASLFHLNMIVLRKDQ